MYRLFDPRSWPSRLVVRYSIAAFLGVFLITNYVLWNDSKAWEIPTSLSFGFKHPIKKLMIDARLKQEALLEKRSFDVNTAAARYRERRGRHPPPGFEQWFEAAIEDGALVVEDYFDRIYKDVTPYWALEPEVLTERASSWHFGVKVRNGTAMPNGDQGGRVAWLPLWTELVQEFAKHLPDVDMPFNYMDESRLLVPFDKIAEYVATEAERRVMPEPAQVTTEYERLTKIDMKKLEPYDPEWIKGGQSYWDLAVETCGPDSAAYGIPQATDFSPSVEFPQNWKPDFVYKGYINNWTAAIDPCGQPHLRQLHGTFLEPISMSTSKELIPLFGGSKLPMNNEILIPGAMYLTDSEFYSGGGDHGPQWHAKKNGIIWRGDASGGRFKENSWHRFQRHRLVDMLNGTTLMRAESEGIRAKTFELPSRKIYKSDRQAHGELGAWINNFADTGFVHICNDGCEWMDPYYHTLESKPMKEQYQYKFLPDADGNSFSARFRGFMRSTSLPLKATIYAEWHDDRLVPWLHFVPLDNTFRDLYPILEFLGDGDGPGDWAAKTIAENGQNWSEQVLRKTDMKLYVWRLLLEWARVCDVNRDTLGFVRDLTDQ